MTQNCVIYIKMKRWSKFSKCSCLTKFNWSKCSCFDHGVLDYARDYHQVNISNNIGNMNPKRLPGYLHAFWDDSSMASTCIDIRNSRKRACLDLAGTNMFMNSCNPCMFIIMVTCLCFGLCFVFNDKHD